METKYPTLRRPKRKLCYFTSKESLPKQWTEPLTLEDVDRMFDDLDSSSQDDDLCPPSPLLQTSDTETNQNEREASPVLQEEHLTKKLPICQMGPGGDVLPPATRSHCPNLDIDLDTPFKVHEPVKTSSPIEENAVVHGVEEEDGEKKVVSPILFDCEDEGKEEAKMEPLTIQKPHCNGHVTEENEDSELESPPGKVTLTKLMIPSHKKKLAMSCKESLPVKEKTVKKPKTTVLEAKRKTPRQENTALPVSAVRQEPEVAAPEKHSRSVHSQLPAETSTRVGKDMTSFLQKLRDAGQSKPACSRKLLSPVKVPTPPPETEDDFLILEDDTPLWISIPNKAATSKKQKQTRSSSTDKDTSTDKGTKENPLETAQKEEESEKAKQGIQPVKEKMKKKRGREKKKNKEALPGNDKFSSPEDVPAGDLVEQEKPNQKKHRRPKPIPLEKTDEAEEEPQDVANKEPDEERPSQKIEKKTRRSSKLKSSKSSKDGRENAKSSRAKSLKGARKVTQESEDIKEMVYDEAVKEQNNQKLADVEALCSLSDNEIMNSDAQTAKDLEDGEAEQNRLPVVSQGSSSEEGQVLGKRKRKQTGQWWLCTPPCTEETVISDNQPTLKKSKQHKKEPRAAEPSPVKAEKDRVLKKSYQKQSAPLSSHNTVKAKKEKKTKQYKNRPAREDMPGRMKATDEVFHFTEAEQVEEEQQEEEEVAPDQDLDPLQSSPLVFTHRDLSLNSGDQVFQRVYQHVSNDKKSSTPAPVTPRRPQEQLRAAELQRRRKPPGNWWMANGTSDDRESISSQPQQFNPKEPKPHKERKKHGRSPRLGTPKNGNMAVSSKPPGGAHVSPVKVKPLSTPKTIKRSLATFKDIFTSSAETPAVVSRKDTGRNNRRNVAASVTPSKTDKAVLSMDAGEFRSTQNSPVDHDPPQDNKCQPEYTFKDLRSGPSSMIELEQYEENDDLILPSSRVHAALSLSDLCAPPLKPLTLQPKDKANLTEWFKSLWSPTVDNGAEITPDQFDWYFYQGRAIGLLMDLNCGSICNGKILLGSYMKKPLWVDHSATTVFNLLTSSVSAVINGRESRLNPGQSFMVQSGHAYSIQNVTAQPAVLYFTRILAESSD
ncbi:microtubule-associated protein 1B-like [Lates japonicus]